MTENHIFEKFSLKNKVVLLTGASSGLGEHFAQTLASVGAHVIVTARRENQLQELAEKIKAQGGKAVAVGMDVSDESSVTSALASIDSMGLTIDVLVNNAGIVADPMSITEINKDDWQHILSVNLNGAFSVATQVAKRMKQRGQGVIINTGSIYSLGTGLRQSAYNVSKAALAQLTRNLAAELVRHGIRVNTLCPGYFKSPLNEEWFNSEAGQHYIKKLVPQRLGHYSELDGALLLLASDAGSFINGAELVVDGGSLINPL